MKKRLLKQLIKALNLSNDFIRRYKKLFNALLSSNSDSDSSSDVSGKYYPVSLQIINGLFPYKITIGSETIVDTYFIYEIGEPPEGFISYDYFSYRHRYINNKIADVVNFDIETLNDIWSKYYKFRILNAVAGDDAYFIFIKNNGMYYILTDTYLSGPTYDEILDNLGCTLLTAITTSFNTYYAKAR